ncbi:MAG: hypothetical protein GX610_12395 [Rhodococcus sp.]|nr:hypothetical protein [Rhodococcus sp. (in: high G+C Gram-positive bacteria)]
MNSRFTRTSLYTVCLAICVAGTASVAPAAASESRPLDCVPVIGTNQLIPPLPGLVTPLPSVKGISEFEDLAPAPAGLDLPSSVHLRDSEQGFNCSTLSEQT